MCSVFSRKSLRFPALMGVVFIALSLAALSWSDTEQNMDAGAGTANPCAAAANPCNPCNPCGGGGKIDPQEVLRPAGTGLHAGLSHGDLLKMGGALWNDRGLSTNGLACGVCHQNNGNFNDTFAKPYPHRVAMPHIMAGADKVALDEMIQFCMLQPMAAEALPWDSPELAALTAYGAQLQRAFAQMSMTNPCNPCNPCAGRQCLQSMRSRKPV